MKDYIEVGTFGLREFFPMIQNELKKINKKHPALRRFKMESISDIDLMVNTKLTKDEQTKLIAKHRLDNNIDSSVKYDVLYNPVLFKYYSKLKSKKDLLNLLFTLKASHLSFLKFNGENNNKHYLDLFILNNLGCTIQLDLYNDLIQFWIEKWEKPRRADFTMKSDNFFDDVVSRTYDHDGLHEQVKMFYQPAFKFLQEPNQETVWVCPNKFRDASIDVKEAVIIEEAHVLALERHILPGKIQDKQIAYVLMLKAMIERLAPDWMGIYILNRLHYFFTYKIK